MPDEGSISGTAGVALAIPAVAIKSNASPMYFVTFFTFRYLFCCYFFWAFDAHE
jgi:hypothetical protein